MQEILKGLSQESQQMQHSSRKIQGQDYQIEQFRNMVADREAMIHMLVRETEKVALGVSRTNSLEEHTW